MKNILRPKFTSLLLIAFVMSIFTATGARAQMPEIALTIAGNKLTAEVAASDPERMQGLMHRRMMPENKGMLFVFTNKWCLPTKSLINNS